MKFPEQEYISFNDTQLIHNITTSHLEWLSENKFLNLYYKHISTNQGKVSYLRIVNPVWSLGTLHFCTAIDSTNSINSATYLAGCDHSMVYFHNRELYKHRDEFCTETLPQHINQESLVLLCNKLKNEGFSADKIAKTIKQKHPEIYPSRIGRLLPANPGANISNDAHRKRGLRLLMQ